MKRKRWIVLISILGLAYAGCSKKHTVSDAYGQFDAIQITLSSEVSGRILAVYATEGEDVKAGDLLMVVDSTDLVLKRKQLYAQKASVQSQIASILAQARVHDQQRINLETELSRLEKLRESGAATDKQWDDMMGAVQLSVKQKTAVLSQEDAVRQQAIAIDAQIAQVDESISKCQVVSPLEGTMLTRFVEPGELVFSGKPLFRLADLRTMILRVYVSGSQLSEVKLGKEVEVILDRGPKEIQTLKGVVSWVSSKAEFTPKIIQTREERVNLVYAVELRVENDGSLKIGMPAEVNFIP